MESVWTIVSLLPRMLKNSGAACLVGIGALTCADISGRFFKHPVFGSVDLVTFMGVIAVVAALPFTHETKGHIGVELLIQRFSKRRRAIVDACTGNMSFILFLIVGWRMAVYATNMKNSGEVSLNLKFPEYAIIYIVAAAFIILAITILKGVIEDLGRIKEL